MSKTQPTAAKLSDSQLVILSAASQRADGSLLPFPQSLTAKGAALNKVVETLCKRKLVEERRTINGAPEWRRDEDRLALPDFLECGVGVESPAKGQNNNGHRGTENSARRAVLHAVNPDAPDLQTKGEIQ